MAAALNSCISCLRWTVFVLNFLFWLVGLGILGVALWLYFDPAVNSHMVTKPSDLGAFYTSIYLLMAAGLIMTIFGLLGCCGALRLNQYMLTAFFILLLIVFSIQFACGLVAYFNQEPIKVFVDRLLTEAMRENYGVDNPKTSWVDDLQSTWECCGVTNSSDYQTSPFNTKISGTPDLGIGSSSNPYVPYSCCNELGREIFKEKCGTTKEFSETRSGIHSIYLHSKGCSQVLQEKFESNIGLIIGLAIGVGCFQLLGMVLSMMLCCLIGYKEQQESAKNSYY